MPGLLSFLISRRFLALRRKAVAHDIVEQMCRQELTFHKDIVLNIDSRFLRILELFKLGRQNTNLL